MGLVLSQIIAKIGELVTAGNQSEDIGSVGEVKLRNGISACGAPQGIPHEHHKFHAIQANIADDPRSRGNHAQTCPHRRAKSTGII